jgi:hypothetical protein
MTMLMPITCVSIVFALNYSLNVRMAGFPPMRSSMMRIKEVSLQAHFYSGRRA